MNPACVKVFDPAKEKAFQARASGGLWLVGAILFPVFFVYVTLVYGTARLWSQDIQRQGFISTRTFKTFTCELIFSGKPCCDCSRPGGASGVAVVAAAMAAPKPSGGDLGGNKRVKPSAVVQSADVVDVEEGAQAKAVVSGTDVAISKVGGDDREV